MQYTRWGLFQEYKSGLTLKINIIHPINRLKVKNHIHRVFLKGIEKVFDKNPTSIYERKTKPNKQKQSFQQK